MKQKLNTLSFFICAFIITLAVIASICFVASLELKNNSLEIDLQRMTANIFGNTYTMDKEAALTLKRLVDYNGVFMGKGVFNTLKGAFGIVFTAVFDFIKIIFYSINFLVNSGAM